MKKLRFFALAQNGIFIFCVVPHIILSTGWTSAYALPIGEFPISSQPNSQFRPDVASSGENYLVVWQHESGGATGRDIWGRIIKKDGNMLDSFPICETNLDQWFPRVAWGTNVNRYLVTWRELENKMYGQFVDINGTLIDTAFVIEEGLIMLGERGNDVASNGNNFLVVWADSVPGKDWDIHGRIVTDVGAFAGPSFTISDAPDSQLFPVALGVGKNYLVAWPDFRTGNQDPYGQRISSTGALIGSNFPITYKSERQRRLALATNDTCILVVWEEDHGGFFTGWELYGSILDTSCTSYIASDFKVAGALYDQRLPSADWHSDSSKFIVGWHDYRGGGESNIYITTVTPSGSVVGEQKITNLDGSAQWKPEVACSDVCFLIVWEDWRAGANNVDIWGYLPEWCPTSVEEESPIYREEVFKIMPNPFKEYVRFIGVERVRIYDSSGRPVSTVNDVWDGKNQKGEELPAGTYFVQSTGNSSRAHKIVKLR